MTNHLTKLKHLKNIAYIKAALLMSLLAISGLSFAIVVIQPASGSPTASVPSTSITTGLKSTATKTPATSDNTKTTTTNTPVPMPSVTQQEASNSFANFFKSKEAPPPTPSLTPQKITSEQINNPTVIAVKDNQMINVTLSSSNINRLYVKDDPIVHVNTPISRLCSMNDSVINASTTNTSSCMSNDATGSVYFNVNGEKPFTVYIQTKKSRHFSLLIVPQDQPGQTIELNPTTPYDPSQDGHIASAKTIEQASSFEKSLVSLLKITMLHQVPKGYVVANKESLKKSVFKIQKRYMDSQVKAHLLAGFLGDSDVVRVISITNTTYHDLELEEHTFYQDGVKAIALGVHTLAPHHSTLIYEVANNV
jgi:type-F conjugative transfer system secretin TraK